MEYMDSVFEEIMSSSTLIRDLCLFSLFSGIDAHLLEPIRKTGIRVIFVLNQHSCARVRPHQTT
jgi:hypothetical protein